MDKETKALFEKLESNDKNEVYEAYTAILVLTEKEVDWAYEVWDQWKGNLSSKDNHKRSLAAQFLSSLAISDPEGRMLLDFPAVWKVTMDKKFVTARHSLQSIWKIGLAGDEQKELVTTHLIERYRTCMSEKNGTLIRFDIIQGLKNLYDKCHDENIKGEALKLIEEEEDSKYRKKYGLVWN
ncbi:hypothetical protein QA612_04710 [Evansella sp. AB-P1]|uniref:hypothetical protein n=1 Tax=Evansella sp. AB-P1 TaxID=3037653 RepID=UPI00241E40DC|nr:hypothetical protein [Evansella sp. AB-P1]MDG5786783.1 hypothetical protein [Evansella sp. AB-P1]